MIRHYCDLCGNVMSPSSTETQPEFTVTLPVANGTSEGTSAVGIKIQRSIDGTWNGGHICPECLALALEDVAEQFRGLVAVS